MNTKQRSTEIRKLIIECIGSLGVGHLGGCLSIADFLSVLYTNHMHVDPKNPNLEGRDRLILSKGHAGPALYATLASFGYFEKERLKTLNQLGTTLPSHCNRQLTPGVDMTTGSLGQGISCAVGCAIASKIKNDGAHIYCVVGDGESQEGQVWEAAMLAAHKKLGNLTVVVDNNKMQIDGRTEEIVKPFSFRKKWEAFGFKVIECDGHDVDAIDAALTLAEKTRSKPTAIILDTVKGKGVSFIEAAGVANHSMSISPEQVQQALKELNEEGC